MLERLEQYFVANGIGELSDAPSDEAVRSADKKKVAVLISLVGKSAYTTLKDLCLPRLPKDKTYAELCSCLHEHFTPKVLEVAESYRFHHAVQGDGETVSDFVNKLKRLASNCNFGTFLNCALRDQFICGIKNQRTKTRLLSEDRSFAQAISVALADETVEKETVSMRPSQEVGSIKFNSKVHGKKHCFRCGDFTHLANVCRFKSVKCSPKTTRSGRVVKKPARYL
ncbi:Uncharacterised protein r2_g3452 [Pycnogonum litorale]